MLKKTGSKAAADESTGGVAFSPARPELLTQLYPDGLRWGSERCENEAWEKVRLGAPGLGGW